MERNAWRVAHDRALHIDDAPVVRLHKGICNREGGGGGFFFFQQDPANHDYLKACETSKNMCLAIIIILQKFVSRVIHGICQRHLRG